MAAPVIVGMVALTGCGTRLPDSAFEQARGEGATVVAGVPSEAVLVLKPIESTPPGGATSKEGR